MKKRYIYEKNCPVCGKMFTTTHGETRTCSHSCASTLRSLTRYANHPRSKESERPKRKGKTLDQRNAEARKKGLTYGEYMADKYMKNLPKIDTDIGRERNDHSNRN